MKRKLVFFLFCILLITGNLFSQSGWIQQNSGTFENLNAIKFFDDNLGWAIGNNGVVLKTTNGGINWISINTGSLSNNKDISIVSSSITYIGVLNGSSPVIKTTNGGQTWATVQYSNVGIQSMWFNSINNGVIIDDDRISKTSDGGNSWFSNTLSTFIRNSDFFFINELKGWLLFSTEPFVSEPGSYIKITSNGGNSWTSIGVVTQSDVILNSIHFITSTIGYTVGGNGSIYKTNNSGINWTSQISNTNSKLNSIISVNPNISYIAGDNGIILHSINGGSNWINQVSGTSTNLNSVYFGTNPNSGWISGNSGQILHTTNGGLGIKNITLYNPIDYKLFQNYPNPFNPTTKIIFDIPRNSNVHLCINDITGRLVLDLFNTKLSPGKYEYTFEADNLSSGIYFYNLTSDQFSSTKRMILLK